MPRHGRRAAKALNTGRQSHAGIAIFIGKPVVLSTCGVETSSSYYHYIGVLHPAYKTYQNINTSSPGLVRADLFSCSSFSNWVRHPKHQTRSSDPTEPPPTTLLEPRLHCILTLPRVLSIGKMFSLSLQLWLARPSCHESVPEPDPVARDCSTPQSQARIQLKAELPRAHDSDAAATPAFSASTSVS